jgi:hypothetical protein
MQQVKAAGPSDGRRLVDHSLFRFSRPSLDIPGSIAVNSKNTFRFSAIAAIGLALLPANLSAQQGIRQQLI